MSPKRDANGRFGGGGGGDVKPKAIRRNNSARTKAARWMTDTADAVAAKMTAKAAAEAAQVGDGDWGVPIGLRQGRRKRIRKALPLLLPLPLPLSLLAWYFISFRIL